MSDKSDTKSCPMCAETIRPTAIVCPHCRHVQGRWWSLRNPNIIGTLTGIFWFGVIFGLAWFLNRVLDGRDFTPHCTKFGVMETIVSQRITSNAAYVVVTGTLTNGSDYSWKNVGVEAQLFDQQGKLIDVVPAPSDYGGFVISKHSVAAFKIESRTGHEMKDYASHKVFVRWAKDARTWP